MFSISRGYTGSIIIDEYFYDLQNFTDLRTFSGNEVTNVQLFIDVLIKWQRGFTERISNCYGNAHVFAVPLSLLASYAYKHPSRLVVYF
mgnify:CR=1 FL=1